MAYFAIELFIKDVEDALADERPLSSVGWVPLFMLMRAASDRLALEALFKNAGGPDWTEKGGWGTNTELGDWHKVRADAEGRVESSSCSTRTAWQAAASHANFSNCLAYSRSGCTRTS